MSLFKGYFFSKRVFLCHGEVMSCSWNIQIFKYLNIHRMKRGLKSPFQIRSPSNLGPPVIQVSNVPISASQYYIWDKVFKRGLNKVILLGYQARIFHFSFFNVLHKSLSFTTWNLIEYLHNQDFQRATVHLNVWTNILLFCFVYGCKQHTKIIESISK